MYLLQIYERIKSILHKVLVLSLFPIVCFVLNKGIFRIRQASYKTARIALDRPDMF